MTANHPAIEKRRLRILDVGDVGDVVSERFAEQRVALDGLTGFQLRKKIEPRYDVLEWTVVFGWDRVGVGPR